MALVVQTAVVVVSSAMLSEQVAGHAAQRRQVCSEIGVFREFRGPPAGKRKVFREWQLMRGFWRRVNVVGLGQVSVLILAIFFLATSLPVVNRIGSS